MGFPPLCTVGAAEFAPPASGTIALFSIAIEFDVFSSPLPVVAAGDVVQLVSCFSLDGLVVWAFADATTNDAAMTAVAKRIIFISRDRKQIVQIRKMKRASTTMVPIALDWLSIRTLGSVASNAWKLVGPGGLEPPTRPL